MSTFGSLCPSSGEKMVYMYFNCCHKPSDDVVRQFRTHLKKTLCLANVDAIADMTYLGSIDGLVSFIEQKMAANSDAEYSIAFLSDGAFNLLHSEEGRRFDVPLSWHVFGYLPTPNVFVMYRSSCDSESLDRSGAVYSTGSDDKDIGKQTEEPDGFVGWESQPLPAGWTATIR